MTMKPSPPAPPPKPTTKRKGKQKTRFDGLDVCAMTALLKSQLLGFKVANVYDGMALSASVSGDSSGKGTFVFKLANPGGVVAKKGNTGSGSATSNDGAHSHSSNTQDATLHNTQNTDISESNNPTFPAKTVSSTNIDPNTDTNTSTTPTIEQDDTPTNRCLLLLESGVRFHTTTYTSPNDSSTPPSNFCMKLRKHLRNLRLENMTQLGQMDRVVDLRFGSGEKACHVILELYGLGNLILTDCEYRILGLLRTHEYVNKSVPGVSTAMKEKSKEKGKEKDSKGPGKNAMIQMDASHASMEDTGEVKVRVGNVYPVTYATTISTDTIHPSTLNDDSSTSKTLLDMTGEEAYQWTKQQLQLLKDKIDAQQKNLMDVTNDPTSATTNATNTSSTTNNKKKKKGKKKDNQQVASINLKQLLLKPDSGVFQYGPALLEHCILSASQQTPIQTNDDVECHDESTANPPTATNNLPLPTDDFTLDTVEASMSPSQWDVLIQYLRTEGPKAHSEFTSGEGKGYILYRYKDNSSSSTTISTKESKTPSDLESSSLSDTLQKIPHSDKVFEEFHPHLLQQHINTLSTTCNTNDRHVLSYSTFSHAVDEFYALLEGQKRALKAEATLQSAKAKLAKIQTDQASRIETLEKNMNLIQRHAQLVGLHADDVDKAMGVINGAIATGMDWETIEELVQVEQANANPIALLIQDLQLEKDVIVLSLPDTLEWDPEDEDELPPMAYIPVQLQAGGAHGNARAMYDQYRSSKEKAAKTLEATQTALLAAEENAKKQIAKAQESKSKMMNAMMGPQRKQHWFEKFHWFITSDNYLVLGGRDAQQNEQLVKRYLRAGDAYIHADVHGAPTCILRAKRVRRSAETTEVLPLSEQALREAGSFAICRSSAWASRMVTSAWWVEAHQVSKTAPTGEYLTVGSFMVRGKKNFLPATQLEMGLGVLFRLGDDASVSRHTNDRRDFALMEYMNRQNTSSLPVKESGKTPIEEKDEIAERAETEQDAIGILDDHNATTDVTDSKPTADNDTEVEEKSAIDKDAEVDAPKKKGKKKGLSVRDRKLIKKYGSLEEAEKILAEQREKEELKAKKKQEASNEFMETAAKQKSNNVRGKKSKMKKIAKKYADQDDEDRELAFLALQGGTKRKLTKKQKKAERAGDVDESINQMVAAAETQAIMVRDSRDVIDKLPEDVQEVICSCIRVKSNGGNENEPTIRWDKLDAEVIEQLISLDDGEAQMAAARRLFQLNRETHVDNYSASLAGIIRTIKKYGYEGIQVDENEDSKGKGKQRKTKAEKAAEKEAWREILAEDGIIEDSGENDGSPVDDTGELDKLTGKPSSDDVILYALPVCAPYYILSQYKYKVKLTPGSLKRGKASKQCVDLFLRMTKDGGNTARYSDLIKAANENDWVQAMCGDVKISAAGASKAVKKQKAAAKKKKK